MPWSRDSSRGVDGWKCWRRGSANSWPNRCLFVEISLLIIGLVGWLVAGCWVCLFSMLFCLHFFIGLIFCYFVPCRYRKQIQAMVLWESCESFNHSMPAMLVTDIPGIKMLSSIFSHPIPWLHMLIFQLQILSWHVLKGEAAQRSGDSFLGKVGWYGWYHWTNIPHRMVHWSEKYGHLFESRFFQSYSIINSSYPNWGPRQTQTGALLCCWIQYRPTYPHVITGTDDLHGFLKMVNDFYIHLYIPYDLI